MTTLETDPTIQTPEDAEKKLLDKGFKISDWAKDILYKTEFSKNKETYELVRFTVGDLGFPEGATTDEIYERAEQLGLELCPAEVGPHLRFSYDRSDWSWIAMKQIADRGGTPHVFSLNSHGAKSWLRAVTAHPGEGWYSGRRFVFRFRK